MNLPEYITQEEVRRVCGLLNIRDWTKLTEPVITLEEADIIQTEIGEESSRISVEQFKRGLEVELEHGLTFPDANVTSNHPILTGKIVLAHLKEMLDYYLRLEVAELEGDLLKAYRLNDPEKMARKYASLLRARADLVNQEQA